MRRRLAVAPFIKSASVAAAFMACPLLAQAASVQAVFAAENALYGAGYGIGQADGWIDDKLRAAVRQYQGDHAGLSTTGELDSQTLTALGISGSHSQLMGGNVVASREAARKKLGLLVASAPAPAPAPKAEPKPKKIAAKPEPVAKRQPEPKPKLKPEPVIASAPAASAQKVSTQKVSEPVAKPEPQKAKPEPVSKPEPKQVAQARAEPEPTKAQSESEPEPTSEPIKITANARASSRDESSAAVAEEVPDKTVNVASVSNPEETQAAEPQEPTTAEAEQTTVSAEAGNESQPTEPKGNVITKVFYFLFGWMV